MSDIKEKLDEKKLEDAGEATSENLNEGLANSDKVELNEQATTETKVDNDNMAEEQASAEQEPSIEKETAQEETVEEEATMESFELGSQRLKSGKIVTGKIIRVTDDELIVNVDYKSDGIVPLKETNIDEDSSLKDHFKEDDPIEVEVIKVNDGEGNVLLSQKRVAQRAVWKDIEKAFTDQTEITGIGKEVVKGGIIAKVNSVTAFVPASQLSTQYVEDLNIYIGQELRLRVLETDKRRNRIVASQKVILAQEEKEKRERLWDSIKEGQKIKGEVKRLTNFGAFVDVGGVDGLIHISDLSWGHINNPKQVVSEGQEVEVVVLSLDRENNKISLGYKQTLAHPWDDIETKYPENSIVEGKVVRIVDFGAFVELEPGVDGLVHISQISKERVEKVEDVLKVGQDVTVKVLSVMPDEKRISLSIKEALEEEKTINVENEDNDTSEEMTFTLGELLNDQQNQDE